MEKIIGKCGLICSECPAYKATIANDDELRKTTAETWSKMFGADIKTEDINCLGCLDKEVVFGHCKECEIRACNDEKGTKNCGECSSYPCDRINEFIKVAPDVKPVLDEIHNNKN